MLEAQVGKKIQETLFEIFQLRVPEESLLSVRSMAKLYGPHRLVKRFLPDGTEQYLIPDISGYNAVLEKLYFQNDHTSLYRINHNGSYILWKVDTGTDATERKEEAILQAIVKTTLEAHGYMQSVPKIYPCVVHPEFGTLVCMEGIPNAVLASKYFSETLNFQKVSVKNDLVVIEILVQLAVYLGVLQRSLGFLHGDLKSNNILLIDPLATQKQFELTLKGVRYVLAVQNQVLLIDYGFSSLQNAEKTAGTDMFLYLATLWRLGPFRQCLTPEFVRLFRSWLTFGGKEWWRFIESGRDTPDLKFTHFQTQREEFTAENARPERVLSDIQTLYKQLLKPVSG